MISLKSFAKLSTGSRSPGSTLVLEVPVPLPWFRSDVCCRNPQTQCH